MDPRPEFALIDWIRCHAPVSPPVTVGIGDDAAVLAPSTGRPQVVTTDMLMEGVDFVLPDATAAQIGHKSLAVNLSDIAAMAAKPTAAFVAVALPKHRGATFAHDLYAAILGTAREYGVTIAGGDTNTWDGPLVIAVTVIGEPFSAEPVLRSGAKAGDWILVTGAFGGSLYHGRHLKVKPRIAEAARLVELAPIHAMIDVSDGLSADLHHILDASGVGADLDAKVVPIHPDVELVRDGTSPLDHALGDGEDFELIATLAAGDAPRVLADWNLPTPLTKIGEISEAKGCRLVQRDSTVELQPRGWCHSWETMHEDGIHFEEHDREHHE